MKRHASADELADLAAGAVKPRKAGKIAAHLASCAHCTEVSSQLSGVSRMLASVATPPMPAHLSDRIEAALASESVQRLASEPATEAGRRDLPASGHHPRPSRQRWRIFGLSGPASRLVAAAGALVIIGAGGYEIATHVSTNAGTRGTASSAGSGHVPPNQLKYGPNVSYRQAGATKSLATVTADTNFTGAKLGAEAVAAVKAARQNGVVPGSAAVSKSAASAPAATHATGASQGTNSPNQGRLTGCVDKIAAGKAVLLVELANFDGRSATIIVIASVNSNSASVWAVRSTCSAANTQVLDHVVARI